MLGEGDRAGDAEPTPVDIVEDGAGAGWVDEGALQGEDHLGLLVAPVLDACYPRQVELEPVAEVEGAALVELRLEVGYHLGLRRDGRRLPRSLPGEDGAPVEVGRLDPLQCDAHVVTNFGGLEVLVVFPEAPDLGDLVPGEDLELVVFLYCAGFDGGEGDGSDAADVEGGVDGQCAGP